MVVAEAGGYGLHTFKNRIYAEHEVKIWLTPVLKPCVWGVGGRAGLDGTQLPCSVLMAPMQRSDGVGGS